MRFFLFLFFFILFQAHFLAAQTSIKFILRYDNVPLALEQNYAIATDSILIETFKFYCSNIELYDNEKRVFTEKDSYHLINAAQAESLEFELKTPKNTPFSHLQFHLGIDSLTNMAGAFGGDLDPTNGMYWTWQTGYINFKLEGKSPLCPTRHNRFQFHLGGYAFPNNTLQVVHLELPKEKPSDVIEIKVDVFQFLKQINLTEQNEVMTLSTETVDLAEKAAQIFSIK